MEECLYQSEIWKTIQKEIYQKKTTEIELFGKKHFCIIKEKKIGPFSLERYQIMGIILPDDETYVQSELKRIKEELKKNHKIIYLQLGFINEITRFKNEKKLSQDFKEHVKEQRIHIIRDLIDRYGLKLSFRENMPVSNIIYHIQKPNEILLEEMHDSCQTKVKRAMNKNIMFKRITTPEEKEKFYQDRYEISKMKGFGIIPKDQYQKLLHYLEENQKGEVFLTELNQDIVGGSICIYTEDTLTYLYGFGNRKYQNIGGHHFLKFKLFEYAREHGLKYVDAMGGAPTGFPEHHLKGVSDFKESLGGEKIEYYGNFDLVLHPIFYYLFKRYKRFQERRKK